MIRLEGATDYASFGLLESFFFFLCFFLEVDLDDLLVISATEPLSPSAGSFRCFLCFLSFNFLFFDFDLDLLDLSDTTPN